LPTAAPSARSDLAEPVRELPRHWAGIRRDWGVLTFYQRFEALMAFLLTCVIGVVIIIAMYRLVVEVGDAFVRQAVNPLDNAVFQRVFGEIMTLLIALEFNHTLQYVVARNRGIIQTRVVILIAQLALARKVIILDLHEAGAPAVGALAFLALSLGVAYWLIDDRTQLRHASGRPKPA
jgi:uncharacterized membrane protein (DUF373 family)